MDSDILVSQTSRSRIYLIAIIGYQDVKRYYNDCKHEELENSTRNGIDGT